MAKVSNQELPINDPVYPETSSNTTTLGSLWRGFLSIAFPQKSVSAATAEVVKKSPRQKRTKSQGPGTPKQLARRICMKKCIERWRDLAASCPLVDDCSPHTSREAVWAAKLSQSVVCSYYDLYLRCCMKAGQVTTERVRVRVRSRGVEKWKWQTYYTGCDLPAESCFLCSKCPPDLTITTDNVFVRLGETRQITCSVTEWGTIPTSWAVISGSGTINDEGLYTAPAVNLDCANSPRIGFFVCDELCATLDLEVYDHVNKFVTLDGTTGNMRLSFFEDLGSSETITSINPSDIFANFASFTFWWFMKAFRHKVGDAAARTMYFIQTNVWFNPDKWSGWKTFCDLNPDFGLCTQKSEYKIPVTAQLISDMVVVNTLVNTSHDYESDESLDDWRIMDVGESGDCEDFALTKAALLISLGYLPECMHIETGIRPGGGGAHAWLVVETNLCDYALDIGSNDLYLNSALPAPTGWGGFVGRNRQFGMNWGAIDRFGIFQDAIQYTDAAYFYILDPKFGIMYRLDTSLIGYAPQHYYSMNASETDLWISHLVFNSPQTREQWRIVDNAAVKVSSTSITGPGFIGPSGVVVPRESEFGHCPPEVAWYSADYWPLRCFNFAEAICLPWSWDVVYHYLEGSWSRSYYTCDNPPSNLCMTETTTVQGDEYPNPTAYWRHNTSPGSCSMTYAWADTWPMIHAATPNNYINNFTTNNGPTSCIDIYWTYTQTLTTPWGTWSDSWGYGENKAYQPGTFLFFQQGEDAFINSFSLYRYIDDPQYTYYIYNHSSNVLPGILNVLDIDLATFRGLVYVPGCSRL